MSLIHFSTSDMALMVCERLLPGGVVTFIKIQPMSSSGTRPVLVVFIRTTSRAILATSAVPTIHLRRKNHFTPPLYRRIRRLNEASKAWWKREEKLSFWPVEVSMCGVMIRAHKAGLRVRALMAEMPTATAIVKPNCM